MRGYNIPENQVSEAVDSAYKMAQIERPEGEIPPDLYVVIADIAGFINVPIEIENEEFPVIPQAILRGAIVPMLTGRLAAGIQTVTSMTEGGDSVTFKQSVTSDVTGYKSILAPYKRLGSMEVCP